MMGTPPCNATNSAKLVSREETTAMQLCRRSRARLAGLPAVAVTCAPAAAATYT